MGGKTRIIIIEENSPPISLIASTGEDNDFIFSQDFIEGNYEKAKETLIENTQYFKQDNLLSPVHYGLTVLDFKHKKLFALTTYNQPGLISAIIYHLKLKGTYGQEEQKIFEHLTQEEFLVFKNEGSHDFLTAQEFFGTTNCKEIIKQLNAQGMSNDFDIKPKNFDLHCKYYNEYDFAQLFIDLHQIGIPFRPQDINAWYEYLNEADINKEEIIQIKDYLIMIDEKTQLEKVVTNNLQSNHKYKI